MQYRPFLKYFSQISTQQSTRKVELYNTKITCFLVQIATQRKVKIFSNKEKVRWVLPLFSDPGRGGEPGCWLCLSARAQSNLRGELWYLHLL